MISARGDEKTKAEDEKTIMFGHGMISNSDLSKQRYTFSVTCFHIYPGWYQLNISKIIRTFVPGGLMPDFYC